MRAGALLSPTPTFPARAAVIPLRQLTSTVASPEATARERQLAARAARSDARVDDLHRELKMRDLRIERAEAALALAREDVANARAREDAERDGAAARQARVTYLERRLAALQARITVIEAELASTSAAVSAASERAEELEAEKRETDETVANLVVAAGAMRDREAKIKEEARSLRVALEEAARRHEASIVAAEDIMRRTRNATEDPPDAPTKDANSITAASEFAAVGVGDRLVRLQARVEELADRERRAFVRRQELAREVDVARTTAEEERARRISAEAAARETMDRLKRDTWAARETASRLEAENTSLVTKLRAALGGIGGFGAANGWESPAALTLSTSRDDG